MTRLRRFLDDWACRKRYFTWVLALQVFVAVGYVSGDRVLPGELSFFLALAGGAGGHGRKWANNAYFSAAFRPRAAQAPSLFQGEVGVSAR